MLDETLQIIATDQSGAARGVEYWVQILSGDTWSLRKMREQSLKSVRERVLAGLVRKGVLEEQQRKKGGTYYAAAFFDPSLNTSSVRLHDAGHAARTSRAPTARSARWPAPCP